MDEAPPPYPGNSLPPPYPGSPPPSPPQSYRTTALGEYAYYQWRREQNCISTYFLAGILVSAIIFFSLIVYYGKTPNERVQRVTNLTKVAEDRAADSAQGVGAHGQLGVRAQQHYEQDSEEEVSKTI